MHLCLQSNSYCAENKYVIYKCKTNSDALYSQDLEFRFRKELYIFKKNIVTILNPKFLVGYGDDLLFS